MPDLVPVLRAYRDAVSQSELRFIATFPSVVDNEEQALSDLRLIWQQAELWKSEEYCDVRFGLGSWSALPHMQLTEDQAHRYRGFCRAADLVLDSIGDGGVFIATPKLIDLYEDSLYLGGDCLDGYVQMLQEYGVHQYLHDDDDRVASLCLATLCVVADIPKEVRRFAINRFLAKCKGRSFRKIDHAASQGRVVRLLGQLAAGLPANREIYALYQDAT